MMKRKSSPSPSSEGGASSHEGAKARKLLEESNAEWAEICQTFSSAPPAFLTRSLDGSGVGRQDSVFVGEDSDGSSSACRAANLSQRRRSPRPQTIEDHVAPSPVFVTTPHRNDVLIGKGCETFHHVGNRRFRILVEINFHNYFKENASSSHRDGVVRAVMSSVQGNHPPGRFLVPHDCPDDDSNLLRDAMEASAQPNIKWKLASRAEAEAKVHSTFLAAGRFLVAKATVLHEREEEKEDALVQQMENNQTCHDNSAVTNSINQTPPNHVQLSPGPTSDPTGSHAPISPRPSAHQPNWPSTATVVKCPQKIRDFITRPLSQYFVMEPAVTNGLPSLPPTYIVPSNYDILCGQNSKDYFHHIGNRRFRILIEMSVKRYETLLMHPTDDHCDSIQTLVGETLLSVSKCDPPGRFLGMDFTTGRWRILNPIFAQLKTEQTFFECMLVTQRKLEQYVTMERHHDIVYNEEEADDLLASATASTVNLQNALSSLFTFPCHAFGLAAVNPVDLSALQSQSLLLLSRVRHFEASAVSPSLTDQGTLHNVSADECLSTTRHGFYPKEVLNPTPDGEKAQSESMDMMEVVGGMLQLGQLDKRPSV